MMPAVIGIAWLIDLVLVGAGFEVACRRENQFVIARFSDSELV